MNNVIDLQEWKAERYPESARQRAINAWQALADACLAPGPYVSPPLLVAERERRRARQLLGDEPA